MKIITKLLALVAMTAIALSAQALTIRDYYGSIVKIQSNVSGAGKVYGKIGNTTITADNITTNGGDDTYMITDGNGVVADPSVSNKIASINYTVGVVPNDGFTFLGWEDADGNILSTEQIANVTLKSTSELGTSTSAPTNPKLAAGEYDILLTAKFEDPFTGINGIEARPVASVKYVNLMGQTSNEPFEGVNIVVTNYVDGTQTTTKVIK